MSHCHPEVYLAANTENQLRPWITWCHGHEPAPNRGNSCRGILATCPTWRDAYWLAYAHATVERLRLR